MVEPLRGEVWRVDPNPTRGHEQTGKRPGLIASIDLFNQGPAGLVVILPITIKVKGIPFHVEINIPVFRFPFVWVVLKSARFLKTLPQGMDFGLSLDVNNVSEMLSLSSS